MPRFVTETLLPGDASVGLDALALQVPAAGPEASVRCLYSFLTPDRKRLIRFYDGPSLEAVRRSVDRSPLPVDDIVELRHSSARRSP